VFPLRNPPTLQETKPVSVRPWGSVPAVSGLPARPSPLSDFPSHLRSTGVVRARCIGAGFPSDPAGQLGQAGQGEYGPNTMPCARGPCRARGPMPCARGPCRARGAPLGTCTYIIWGRARTFCHWFAMTQLDKFCRYRGLVIYAALTAFVSIEAEISPYVIARSEATWQSVLPYFNPSPQGTPHLHCRRRHKFRQAARSSRGVIYLHSPLLPERRSTPNS